MASAVRVPLGAPGVYRDTDVPLRSLTGVRMDICAFVGVAPRGPARVPVFNEHWRDDVPAVEPARPRRRTTTVKVESFDEYRALYGGFEGPGLLPYAVAAFFEQGGRCAYVARIVHEYGGPQNDARVATGTVGGTTTTAGKLTLRARDEGSWGNGLSARMRFTYRPMPIDGATTSTLTLPEHVREPAGTLVRLRFPDGSREYRFLSVITEQGLPTTPGVLRQATLSLPTALVAESAEVVEAEIEVDDGDGREETHQGLGLSSIHPRWMATVLSNESRLVFPDASWIDAGVTPDETQEAEAFTGGEDDYENIVHEDFFDSLWTLGDDEPGDGVHCLTHLRDLSIVVVPDLYSPEPLVANASIADPVSLAGPTFERCVDLPPAPPEPPPKVAELEGLRLDPETDLDAIIALQLRLENLAATLRSFIVLLDVPPGLHQNTILKWRAQFRSAFAAAYHPWLRASRRDDSRDALIRVPPSAVAAGIIARTEEAFGVPHGPANALAREIVDVDDRVSSASHDILHPEAVNVYLREPDGVRLTAARTLSRDTDYRQLSVRRLITMIARTLEQQTEWLVFEPNTGALRAEVRRLLRGYLRQLFRAGAFRGATEEEAFFVECDEDLNPPWMVDAGRLTAHVGVAPAEPVEFIVLRLSRGGDGTLTVEETRNG